MHGPLLLALVRHLPGAPGDARPALRRHDHAHDRHQPPRRPGDDQRRRRRATRLSLRRRQELRRGPAREPGDAGVVAVGSALLILVGRLVLRCRDFILPLFFFPFFLSQVLGT